MDSENFWSNYLSDIGNYVKFYNIKSDNYEDIKIPLKNEKVTNFIKKYDVSEFEFERFAEGTKSVAAAIAESVFLDLCHTRGYDDVGEAATIAEGPCSNACQTFTNDDSCEFAIVECSFIVVRA